MADPTGGIGNIRPTYPVTPPRRPRKEGELENDQRRAPTEERERRDDDNDSRIDERA
ncbi:MAG: hypothetical protein AAF351_10525 [Pseudomonadota bacterium]